MLRPILIAAGSLIGLLAVVLLTRRVQRFGWRKGLRVWQTALDDQTTRVDFYNRLLKALEKQGVKREAFQTPLEFAAVSRSNDAAAITRIYNRVRFGNERLTANEQSEIENALRRLEKGIEP